MTYFVQNTPKTYTWAWAAELDKKILKAEVKNNPLQISQDLLNDVNTPISNGKELALRIAKYFRTQVRSEVALDKMRSALVQTGLFTERKASLLIPTTPENEELELTEEYETVQDGTPLTDACRKGDIKKAIEVLQNGSSIIPEDFEYRDILFSWACQHGLAGPIRKLLLIGADVNLPNMNLKTPFELFLEQDGNIPILLGGLTEEERIGLISFFPKLMANQYAHIPVGDLILIMSISDFRKQLILSPPSLEFIQKSALKSLCQFCSRTTEVDLALQALSKLTVSQQTFFLDNVPFAFRHLLIHSFQKKNPSIQEKLKKIAKVFDQRTETFTSDIRKLSKEYDSICGLFMNREEKELGQKIHNLLTHFADLENPKKARENGKTPAKKRASLEKNKENIAQSAIG